MSAEDYKQEMLANGEAFLLIQRTKNELYTIIFNELKKHTSEGNAMLILRNLLLTAYCQGALDASEIIKRDIKRV